MRFNAIGYHGLIGHEEHRAAWNFIVETHAEDGGALHVDCHGAYAQQVLLKIVIEFPDASIGG